MMSQSEKEESVIYKLIYDPECGLEPYIKEKIKLENRLLDFLNIGKQGGIGDVNVELGTTCSTPEYQNNNEDKNDFSLLIIQAVSVELGFDPKTDDKVIRQIRIANLQGILDRLIINWSKDAMNQNLIEEPIDFFEGETKPADTKGTLYRMYRRFELVYLLE